MPRLLAPMSADSFSRTSNPSLRGSKTLLDQLTGVGSASTASSRQTHSTRKSHSKGSRFSLARRSSMTKQKSGLSSTSSLRRQKSSRQNSLLSYARMAEEPTKQNAEWNFTQAPPPKQNTFWDILNQGPASAQGPPSLASSNLSGSTENSSQASLQLQCSALPSPPTSLPADDAPDDLLQGFALHGASLQHPTILHPTNSLQRSRRSSSFVPSRINEEDAWGHFVETADAEEDLERRLGLLSMARKRPASFAHFQYLRG